MIVMVMGAAVILLAFAFHQGWFSPDGKGKKDGTGKGGSDSTEGGAVMTPKDTSTDGQRVNHAFPVRTAKVAKERGGADNGAEAEPEAEADGNVRGKHAVAGAAVRTSCTPSASSEMNIAANQCRGRGARYEMYGSIGRTRDMASDPQKRGILASNVAPYPRYTDEQPQDYQDLYKAVNGRHEDLTVQLFRQGSNALTFERAKAANGNGLVPVPQQLSEYTGDNPY